MADESGALSGRILVVDDEEAIARVLAKVVRQLGYEPVVATSFDAVRQVLNRQRVDLATLDVVMPGTDGLGILHWLKEHHPEIGVIMATALGDADSVIEAMRLGACDYLVKPFRIDLVEQELRRGMERQALLAQSRQYQQRLEATVAQQTEELRRLNAALTKQVSELSAHNRLVRFQLEFHTPAEAREEVIGATLALLGGVQVSLYQVAGSGDRLELAGYADGEDVVVASLGRGSSGPPEWATAMRPAAAGALHRSGAAARGDFLSVRLKHGKEVMGVLVVEGPQGGLEAWSEALANLADLAALVLWKVRVLELVEQGAVDAEALLDME